MRGGTGLFWLCAEQQDTSGDRLGAAQPQRRGTRSVQGVVASKKKKKKGEGGGHGAINSTKGMGVREGGIHTVCFEM